MISVVSRVRRWFEDDSNYWGVVLLGMSVENGVVFGVLNNDPGIVEGYRIGQSLQARVSELNDWMIASDSGMKGGFTVPRVAQVGANQQQA